MQGDELKPKRNVCVTCPAPLSALTLDLILVFTEVDDCNCKELPHPELWTHDNRRHTDLKMQGVTWRFGSDTHSSCPQADSPHHRLEGMWNVVVCPVSPMFYSSFCHQTEYWHSYLKDFYYLNAESLWRIMNASLYVQQLYSK